MRIAVVGAGVMGRLTALALVGGGHEITLHDDARACASAVAAGLLSPLSGRELPAPAIVALALESLGRWRALLPQLGAPVPFADDGSLVLAHAGEGELLDELRRGLSARVQVRPCVAASLEPALAGRFTEALHLPDEAWLDPRAALEALGGALRRAGVIERGGAVDELGPGALTVGAARRRYEWVVDCRGLGARRDLPSLRGVRGELLLVHAPEVELTRPVRVLHARTPLYVVPRGRGRYVIGATLVESEDPGPISVRAALELLSMAYALHPGFGEAQILETATGCRPAMPDHLPLVEARPGLVRLNGLYRHGFVIAPALAERARRIVEAGCEAEEARCVSA